MTMHAPDNHLTVNPGVLTALIARDKARRAA